MRDIMRVCVARVTAAHRRRVAGVSMGDCRGCHKTLNFARDAEY